MIKTIHRICDVDGRDTGLSFGDKSRAERAAKPAAGNHLNPERPCTMCGHDVGGPPAEDVKLEENCFPCLSGRLSMERQELLKAARKALAFLDLKRDSRTARFARSLRRLIARIGKR